MFNTGHSKRRKGNNSHQGAVNYDLNKKTSIFHAVQFVNETESKKKLPIIANYKNRNRLTLLVQLIMNA